MNQRGDALALQLELRELEKRVSPFASGADQSIRYAGEMHEWLEARYGEDERFGTVLEALDGFPSRVGRIQVEQACRDLLISMHADLHGPRFPWRDVPEQHLPAWRERFQQPRDNTALPGSCPVCERLTLHGYYRRSSQKAGALWDWCSTCFCYEHARAAVPDWWAGDATLDRVDDALLEHTPEFLERELRAGLKD